MALFDFSSSDFSNLKSIYGEKGLDFDKKLDDMHQEGRLILPNGKKYKFTVNSGGRRLASTSEAAKANKEDWEKMAINILKVINETGELEKEFSSAHMNPQRAKFFPPSTQTPRVYEYKQIKKENLTGVIKEVQSIANKILNNPQPKVEKTEKPEESPEVEETEGDEEVEPEEGPKVEGPEGGIQQPIVEEVEPKEAPEVKKFEEQKIEEGPAVETTTVAKKEESLLSEDKYNQIASAISKVFPQASPKSSSLGDIAEAVKGFRDQKKQWEDRRGKLKDAQDKPETVLGKLKGGIKRNERQKAIDEAIYDHIILWQTENVPGGLSLERLQSWLKGLEAQKEEELKALEPGRDGVGAIQALTKNDQDELERIKKALAAVEKLMKERAKSSEAPLVDNEALGDLFHYRKEIEKWVQNTLAEQERQIEVVQNTIIETLTQEQRQAIEEADEEVAEILEGWDTEVLVEEDDS
ncbi:MAG: hypothetical protein ACQEP8_01000 [Chlamydiota bacterium]